MATEDEQILKLIHGKKSYEDMPPTIVISFDRAAVHVKVLKEEGLPMGRLKLTVIRMYQEIQKIRSQKRIKDKAPERQKQLDTDIEGSRLSEGQEMAKAFQEHKESKLPAPDLSKQAVTQ